MYIQEVAVSLTHIDIDDEILETAKRLGGHRTKTAAVAAALEVRMPASCTSDGCAAPLVDGPD
ncbi:type II toxin-antitoxin system VapB family antitoxin [Streptomyces sp. NPDC001401]|uniref:type II toxin-antitoxin system VapB family antitoxin n=1 Tax=Streptomyces sp. NPDC001401 TaxID=3364570 RepID=UPI0036C25D68